MKTLAGSIDKQLKLDIGLASVINPTFTFSKYVYGLATLPAIQLNR